MRKFFIVLTMVLALAFAGTAIAGGNWNTGDFSNAPTGNFYSGVGSNNVSSGNYSGWGIGGGLTGTDGHANSDGFVEGIGFASSTGKGKVNTFSSYGAIGFISGSYRLTTSGSAQGGSGAKALAGPNSRTWAEGGSHGAALYEGTKNGKFCGIGLNLISGSAFGKSGTLAGAYQTEGFAAAGAVTGSMSGANVGGKGNTNAWGQGDVSHQTFAAKGTAYGVTQGYASYDYNNLGGNSILGAGIAATGGFSKVTQTPTTVSVHSRSVSIAISSGD